MGKSVKIGRGPYLQSLGLGLIAPVAVGFMMVLIVGIMLPLLGIIGVCSPFAGVFGLLKYTEDTPKEERIHEDGRGMSERG